MGDKRIIVAIDGPAGAGKSTLAQRLATKLGYTYINTGAMYRAVALWAIRTGTSLSDMHRLEQLANEAKIELLDGGNRIQLNGEDVTRAIGDPGVSEAASQVAAVPAVRRALVAVQREIAQTASVVMEGRDIGSVVFPDAQVKIFLDAHPGERANRRTLELRQRGQNVDVADVAADLVERDKRDRTRAEAPLLQAPDAQLVDTTGLSLDEVEVLLLRIVRARTSNGKEAGRSGAAV